ncbi:hypothetical protein D9M71_538990 [compost metagenome]
MARLLGQYANLQLRGGLAQGLCQAVAGMAATDDDHRLGGTSGNQWLRLDNRRGSHCCDRGAEFDHFKVGFADLALRA